MFNHYCIVTNTNNTNNEHPYPNISFDCRGFENNKREIKPQI